MRKDRLIVSEGKLIKRLNIDENRRFRSGKIINNDVRYESIRRTIKTIVYFSLHKRYTMGLIISSD